MNFYTPTRRFGLGFDLVDSFPKDSDYPMLVNLYDECERWYSGEWLDILIGNGDSKADLYPVRYNPFPTIVSKHVSMVFGDFRPGSGSIIEPRVYLSDGTTNAQSEQLERTLRWIWMRSGGGAMQIRAAHLSQIYGGCVFKISYLPSGEMQIESVHPRDFYAVPNPSHEFDLEQAWIKTVIPRSTAITYGVPESVLGDDEEVLMIEEWSKDRHRISINGYTARLWINNQEIVFDEPNPYGFVPVVYIPHVRTVSYWGENIILPLVGLVKELNLRLGDFGDAVSEDSHPIYAYRNVSGSPVPVRLSNGIVAINLGSGVNKISGSGSDPDMFMVSRSGLASQATRDNVVLLIDLIRRESLVPSVADGVDEGSQRSAQTLAVRMWPLVSHAKLERQWWSSGISWLNHMLLKMMFVKSLIKEDPTDYVVDVSWPPILPKDRSELVNELVQRVAVGLVSPETAMDILGDIDDITSEMSRVKEWLSYNATVGKPQDTNERRESKS